MRPSQPRCNESKAVESETQFASIYIFIGQHRPILLSSTQVPAVTDPEASVCTRGHVEMQDLARRRCVRFPSRSSTPPSPAAMTSAALSPPAPSPLPPNSPDTLSVTGVQTRGRIRRVMRKYRMIPSQVSACRFRRSERSRNAKKYDRPERARTREDGRLRRAAIWKARR